MTRPVVLSTSVRLLAILAVIAGLSFPPGVAAQDTSGTEEARERVQDATEVLREMLGMEETIPRQLLDQAEAVAVIPNVIRGAFIVGGRWGKGVAVKRDASGAWGPAAFIEVGGASVGLQAGGSATDLVLVFTSDEGLDALLEDRVELGADVSVAAGPVGRTGEIGTNLTLDTPIYAYSRSEGLFAGVALDGTVVTIDDSANEDAFGRPIDGDAALADDVETPDVFTPLVAAVAAATTTPPAAN